jgi:hypothetical protein
MFPTSKYTPFATISIATGYFCKSEFRYSFRFNGQEQDNEISGTGNIMTAEFWMYDGRLGRRWNVDPKPQIYLSDYSVMGDNPILFLDRLGDAKQSRHLDGDGKVIAEYNDGDNSVYKHQTAKTKQEVDYWRNKFKNNSGNGVKLGTMSGSGKGVFDLNTFNSNRVPWKRQNIGNEKSTSEQTSYLDWPKITANVEAIAGIKTKVGPIGFGGGRSVIVGGIKDNEIQILGHNLSTGQIVKNDQFALQPAGQGFQISTTYIKNNNSWIKVSTEVEVVNFNFIFISSKTNSDGSREESISIGIDAGIGFGLAVNGGIKIPLYSKKYY